ncbi:MAG: OmpA family protein [Planktomarina sp.]
MRNLLGGLVLVAGVGALGWWGTVKDAKDMEAEIRATAQAAVGSTTHPVLTSVSGRDISVSGLADTAAEKEAILNRLSGIEGRRVVADGLDVLPVAAPFVFGADKTETGVVYSGNTPTESHRVVFAERVGDAAIDLTLASGMPDGEWPGVVGQGLDALGNLKNGALRIENQAITLSGLAALPTNKEAALSALAGLPAGYTLNHNIALEDDGTPMRLTLRKDENGANAVGKMPVGTDLAAVMGEGVDASGVQIAKIAAPTAGWDATVVETVAAVSGLLDGTLTIVDTDVSVTGTAMRVDKEAAEARLANLPEHYEVKSNIALYDNGMPITIVASTEGGAPSVMGKAPYGFDPSGLQAAFGPGLDLSNIYEAQIDGPANFGGLLDTGLSALAELEEGKLLVAENLITLRGAARTPQEIANVEALLAKAPDGANVPTDLTFLDDGSAPAWQYSYADGVGGDISGKLPNGLAKMDVPGLIGVPNLEGEVTEGLMGSSDTAKATLQQMAPWMNSLETATITGEGDAVSVAAVAKADAPFEKLDAAMQAAVGAPLTLKPSANAVLYGTIRKLDNGGVEQFTQDGWMLLPELDLFNFEPSVANCDARSRRVLLLQKINFVTGGADVDQASQAVLDDLSKIITRCFEDETLAVEIGGHTDDVGSDDANMALSNARAAAVKAVLANLGVNAERMTAKGYGESTPLADNATDAGRAMNRRTEFAWSSINQDN